MSISNTNQSTSSSERNIIISEIIKRFGKDDFWRNYLRETIAGDLFKKTLNEENLRSLEELNSNSNLENDFYKTTWLFLSRIAKLVKDKSVTYKVKGEEKEIKLLGNNHLKDKKKDIKTDIADHLGISFCSVTNYITTLKRKGIFPPSETILKKRPSLEESQGTLEESQANPKRIATEAHSLQQFTPLEVERRYEILCNLHEKAKKAYEEAHEETYHKAYNDYMQALESYEKIRQEQGQPESKATPLEEGSESQLAPSSLLLEEDLSLQQTSHNLSGSYSPNFKEADTEVNLSFLEETSSFEGFSQEEKKFP